MSLIFFLLCGFKYLFIQCCILNQWSHITLQTKWPCKSQNQNQIIIFLFCLSFHTDGRALNLWIDNKIKWFPIWIERFSDELLVLTGNIINFTNQILYFFHKINNNKLIDWLIKKYKLSILGRSFYSVLKRALLFIKPIK